MLLQVRGLLNCWKEATINACEKYLQTTRQPPDVAVYRFKI